MYCLMRRHLFTFRRTFLWACLLYLPVLLAISARGGFPALLVGAQAGFALGLFPAVEGLLQPKVETFLASLPVTRGQVVREAFLSGPLLLAASQGFFLVAGAAVNGLWHRRAPALEPGILPTAALMFLGFCALLFLFVTLRFTLRGWGVAAFSVALLIGALWQARDGFAWGAARVAQASAHPLLACLGLALLGGLGCVVSTRAHDRRDL
jgi:hypothetical protein